MNREIFETLLEAKVLVERWKTEYNTERPHSTLNYQPPAPEAIRQEWQNNVISCGRYGSWRYMAREDVLLDGGRVVNILINAE